MNEEPVAANTGCPQQGGSTPACKRPGHQSRVRLPEGEIGAASVAPAGAGTAGRREVAL